MPSSQMDEFIRDQFNALTSAADLMIRERDSIDIDDPSFYRSPE